MKIDTHIHSKYSKDSITPLENIIKYSKKIGLNAIAITDHDEIKGTWAIRELEHDDLLLIPGEEVSTSKGHIVALGITDYIKPLQSPEETIDEIHDNAGIAKNSRYILGISNYLSKKVSNKNNIPEIGASDAHFVEGIGCCYTEIPVTDSVDTLLKYIKKGKSTAHGKRTPMDLIIREVIRKKGHRTKPKEN